MSDEPSNLVLELLRAVRAELGLVRETLREHGYRLSHIDAGVASLRRDQGHDAEQVAHVEAKLDRLRERIEHIEKRLDIKDGESRLNPGGLT